MLKGDVSAFINRDDGTVILVPDDGKAVSRIDGKWGTRLPDVSAILDGFEAVDGTPEGDFLINEAWEIL